MKADKVVGGVLAAGLGCIAGATLGGFIGFWAGAFGWTEGGEEPWARALILGGMIGSVAGVSVLSLLNRKRGSIAEGVVGGLIGIALEAAALAWLFEYRSSSGNAVDEVIMSPGINGGNMRLSDRFKPKKKYVWKNGSVIATASSRKKSNAATTIEKEDFEMALPGVWHEQPADNGCEFVNRSSGEVLIVSVLRAHELAGLSELRPDVEQLDVVRRQMIEAASLGQAILSPTQFRGTERDLEARFDGHDPQNGVRFSVLIRGCAGKVLTLSLYRDSLTELATPFTVYASLIFNLLKMRGGS